MKQKYYFLSGLSRSGNTVLASILNQNPKIALTGNSIITSIIWKVFSVYDDELFVNIPDKKSIHNVIKNIIPNYYSDWSQEYIIDRGEWGIHDNLEMLKEYLTNDIKIIVLVRNVAEVLASFIKFSNENPNFFLNKVGKTVEEKCNFLLRNDETGVGQICGQISSIYNLLLPENRKYCCFIGYDELINNTEKTIDKIYDFLDIPKFNHYFTNLNQFKVNDISYNDDVLGGKLHSIRTNNISKNEYNIKDILPNEIIEDCIQLNEILKY